MAWEGAAPGSDSSPLASPETGLTPIGRHAEGMVAVKPGVHPVAAALFLHSRIEILMRAGVRQGETMSYAMFRGGLALAFLALGSGSVFAASDSDRPLVIVVTPTRTAKTADASLTPVTVITRSDIERTQAQSTLDVLRGVPGVGVTSSGGEGKLSSVFLRGTNSGHVLVLVDGVKHGSATAGTTAFEFIPVDQIERVEVVRGPRSSLYGSEAIGGVIQIFTRKGGGKLTPSFSVTGGSYETGQATAGISGGGDHAWFNVNASGASTQGFNSCDGDPVAFLGCFANEPDDDAYRTASGNVRGGYRFDNGAELDAHWLRAGGKVFYDGAPNESETVQQVIGASARFAAAKTWTVTLLGGRSWDELDSFTDGAFMSRFDTERDSVSVQNDFTLAPRHIVTLGGDYQKDSVDVITFGPFAVTSRDNKAVFAQYQAGFGRHDFEISGRGDDNEQFGNHTTGSAAWGVNIMDRLRATASYGTAFKAPTFNQLYFPPFVIPGCCTFITSNPNLDPETSRSAEFGLHGGHQLGSWSVNLFETRIDDLIVLDAAFVPANISAARIRGLELETGAEIDAWRANAALTLLDPKDRSGGPNHANLLPRRTRQSLRVDIDRDFGLSSLGMTVLGEGKRYDDAANTRKLGRYATVDLRAQHRIAKNWLLQAKAANLLDANYETVDFFNQAGRSLFLTLRYVH